MITFSGYFSLDCWGLFVCLSVPVQLSREAHYTEVVHICQLKRSVGRLRRWGEDNTE